MYPLTQTFLIPKIPGETSREYSHRCWFVGNQNPKTITELNQAIKWSQIEVNDVFHGCVYSEDVQDKSIRLRDGLFKSLEI